MTSAMMALALGAQLQATNQFALCVRSIQILESSDPIHFEHLEHLLVVLAASRGQVIEAAKSASPMRERGGMKLFEKRFAERIQLAWNGMHQGSFGIRIGPVVFRSIETFGYEVSGFVDGQAVPPETMMFIAPKNSRSYLGVLSELGIGPKYYGSIAVPNSGFEVHLIQSPLKWRALMNSVDENFKSESRLRIPEYQQFARIAKALELNHMVDFSYSIFIDEAGRVRLIPYELLVGDPRDQFIAWVHSLDPHQAD